jgi:SAM-dependent methyltransferase
MRFDCPFCGSNEAKIYRSDQKVRDIEEKSRNVVTCLHCGTFYPQPRITFSEIVSSIEEKTCRGVTLSKPPTPFSTTDISNHNFQIKILKKYKENFGLKNALDIGTSNGCFCYILNHVGLDAYGLEPQSEAVGIAKRLNLNVYQGYFPNAIPPELLGQRYDLITMNEVVYYFEDITASLKKTYELLLENGILILKIHHGESHYYDNDISLFSRYGDQVQSIPTVPSINHWLKSCGFELLEILPYPDDYFEFLIGDKFPVPRQIKAAFNLVMPTLIAYLLYHNRERVNEMRWTRRVDRIVIVAKKKK